MYTYNIHIVNFKSDFLKICLYKKISKTHKYLNTTNQLINRENIDGSFDKHLLLNYFSRLTRM